VGENRATKKKWLRGKGVEKTGKDKIFSPINSLPSAGRKPQTGGNWKNLGAKVEGTSTNHMGYLRVRWEKRAGREKTTVKRQKKMEKERKDLSLEWSRWSLVHFCLVEGINVLPTGGIGKKGVRSQKIKKKKFSEKWVGKKGYMTEHSGKRRGER